MLKSDSILQYSVENAVFESSPEAIVVIDKIGRIIRVNPRLHEWLGFTQDEIVGKHLIQLPFLSPQTKQLVIKKFLARTAGKHISPYTFECISKKGEIKIGKIRASIIYDQEGKAIGEVAMIEEVTEEVQYRKLAELRDKIIEAVGFAADQFLQNETWEKPLLKVLSRLAEATTAERIFIYKVLQSKSEISIQQIGLWSDNKFSQKKIDKILNEELLIKIITKNIDKLVSDQFISFADRHKNVEINQFLRQGARKSCVIFPLFFKKKFWGFLGFDNIDQISELSVHDFEALTLVRDILQAAILRNKNVIAIKTKDEILEITNNFNHQFNLNKNWDIILKKFFMELGSALQADYIRFCPSHDIPGENVSEMVEWKSDLLANNFQFAYKKDCFNKCLRKFEIEELVNVEHYSLSQGTQGFFEPWSKPFQQYMIIPVGESSNVWGLLFIGSIRIIDDWSESERESLKLFSRVMGSIFNKQKSTLELERREKILTAVSDAAKHFLKYETWQQDMPKILKKIGVSISANQVILAINDLNQRVYEWCDEGSEDCSSKNVFQQIILGKQPFQECQKKIKNGEIVQITDNFPDEELKKIIIQQTTKNAIIIPFFVKGKWWGLLAILDVQEKQWSTSELKSFQIATDIISAAIQNNLTELELRKTVEFWKQEERKVEQEVQDRQKFELAVAGSTDAIVITNTKPEVIYVNPAWEKLTGYKMDEAMGKNPKILQSGKTVQRIYREMWQKIKDGESYFTDEIINKRKNGTEYPARLSVYPVKVGNKNVYYVGIQQDITEFKKIEQLKTDFISIASHQMNTPLSALRWMLELYQKKFELELNPKQKEMIGEMYESTLRMIDLITSLLNLARVESGRMMVEVKKVDLNDLIKTCVQDISTFAQRKKVLITFASLRHQATITADPKILTHIITNLLSNAIKYSPKHKEIEIKLRKVKDNFECHVIDHGYGIPETEKGQIFSKFYRASNVVHKEVDGSGLGLYLVKQLVESSGGEIFFESQEKLGTHFWFTLPAEGMINKIGEVSLTKTLEMKKESN